MKTVVLVVTFMVAFSLTSTAYAGKDHPITTWECEDIMLTSDLHLDHKIGVGTVLVMGYAHDARVTRDGLMIRWDFNGEHSIMMSRDHSAGYYDFTGAKEGEMRYPEENFMCKIVNQD